MLKIVSNVKIFKFVEPKYTKIIYTETLEKVHIEEFMMPFIDYFNLHFIEGRYIET